MKDKEVREFAFSLLNADKEEDVVAILKAKGYWDDPTVWRLNSNRDNNYATIGNQQSRPEAALAEKVVNSIDARQLNECYRQGIDPIKAAAPPTMRHAISLF